jgi:hypothetical protein
MKKSFWILGFLAAFVAGNGYAVGNQDVSQQCVCEPGCHCNIYTVTAEGSGSTTVHYNCIKDAGGAACDKDPVLNLSENSIAPAEGIKPQLSETINVSQQPEIPKIQKKVISARAAKVGTQVKSVNMATPIDVKPQVVEKAAIGEVRPNGPNSWMACPPDCSFYTYPDGVTVCMNHGIECPGNNGGIRYYEGEKPTQYAINDVVSTGEIVGVSLQNNELQKKNTAVSARAAVKPVSQAEKNSLEPVAQGDKDPVEKYKIIWDGYEYTCPCGFVSIDDMPPKCKRGNEDKCKGVVKPVSQDR